MGTSPWDAYGDLEENNGIVMVNHSKYGAKTPSKMGFNWDLPAMNGNIVGYCEGSVIIFDYCIVCRYVCFQSKRDASHSHDPSIHGWFRWFHRYGSKLFSTE